jgi:hypothetical protein
VVVADHPPAATEVQTLEVPGMEVAGEPVEEDERRQPTRLGVG